VEHLNLMKSLIKRPVVFLYFFVLIVVLGIIVHGDYGIGWDEKISRECGLHSYNYVFNGDDALFEFKDRQYGVAFELPLILVEKALNLKDSQQIFRMRHLVNHLLFLIAICFFYLLLKRVFKSEWLALLGALMLLLSPRIFAHSFFNSKDLPFLSMMIISLFTLTKTDVGKWKYLVLHGIITGIAINIRIMGVLIVALSILWFILMFLQHKNLKLFLRKSITYSIVVLISLYVFWPYLWTDPVNHFIAAFREMSNFNWDDPVLFFGREFPGTDVPWYYIAAWIGISTPVLYLIFSLLGFGLFISKLLPARRADIFNDPFKFQIIALLGITVPLSMVIIFNSTLYDDWRQMYFIYPFILITAIFGIFQLIKKFKNKPVIIRSMILLMIVYLAFTGFRMVIIHPHQQVYFNECVPTKSEYIRYNFEMDYWGLSYKQSLEHILDFDKRDKINVLFANAPGQYNVEIIDAIQRSRINIVNNELSADYFISNYRWHPGDYPNGEPFYSIFVNGCPINSVWKLDGKPAD